VADEKERGRVNDRPSKGGRDEKDRGRAAVMVVVAQVRDEEGWSRG